MKTVSICVPTYNGEDHLRTALHSILNQTYQNFELVVNDDCSIDSTPEILSSFNNHRIQFFLNNQHLGLVGNWNRCLQLAGGEYIYIFHQDDLMDPCNIERKVTVMEANLQAGFVFSNILQINSDGNLIGKHWNNSLPSSDVIFDGHEFIRLMLQSGNFVPCPTVMIRSSLLNDLGGFDSRLHYTPDLDMWLRIALHSDVIFLADPLVNIRCHSDQETKQYLGQINEVQEVWYALKIFFYEERIWINNPESLYDLALTQLHRWVVSFLHYSLRHIQIKNTLRYLNTLSRIRNIKKQGLNCLTLNTEIYKAKIDYFR